MHIIRACICCGLLGTVSHAWAAGESPQADALQAFIGAYQTWPALQTDWRLAEPIAGDTESIDQQAREHSEIFAYPDPDGQLWVRREGHTIAAEGGLPIVYQWRAMPVRMKTGERPMHTEIFYNSQYIRVGAFRNLPAEIVTSEALSTLEIIETRRKGMMSVFGLAASRDFMALIRHAIEHLPDAPDLEIVHAPFDTATITSDSLGLSCTIRLTDGVCVAATYTSPGAQTPIIWQVEDWYDISIYPAPYPSIIRRTSIVGGQVTPNIILIDEVITGQRFDQQLFEWASYNETALDRVRNVVLSPDGRTVRSSGNPNPKLPQQFLRGPMRTTESSRVRPANEAVDGDAPKPSLIRPATPMPPNLARIILLSLGGVMIASAFITLIWRRTHA